jgi:small subunit ribosomal protein S6
VRHYEAVIIFDTEADESAITSVLERGLEIVRNNGGTVGTVDRWGKRTLAYELRHRREGYYVVAEFTAEPKAAAELDRYLVLADEVLRHKIMRLPDRALAARKSKAAAGATAAADH